jgi:hypothetical protein
MKLIDQVINQIKRDIDHNDLTALEELLQQIPDEVLRPYLSEIEAPEGL